MTAQPAPSLVTAAIGFMSSTTALTVVLVLLAAL